MAEITWSYLHNPFENQTKSSFKKMNVLATDHHDKLSNHLDDPFIADLYHQEFIPAYKYFKETYTSAHANVGKYRKHTQIVEALFAKLSAEKVKKWDILIQVEYMEGTPEYAGLMTNGRKSFQSGSYESRIMAIKTLLNNLSEYSILANVMHDVQTFYNELLSARNAQQQKENDEAFLSIQLEDARKALAKAMYAVFTGLLYKFRNNVAIVETFYELKYLRNSAVASKDVEKDAKAVPANGRITLFEGELNENSAINVQNVGNIEYNVYVSETGNGTPPENVKTIMPGTSDVVFVEDISDGTKPNYFVVVNNHSVEGKILANVEQVMIE